MSLISEDNLNLLILNSRELVSIIQFMEIMLDIRY